MLKLLIAFVLGIMFATGIITIVLTRHKAGTIFYDDHQMLLQFKNCLAYEKLSRHGYIIVNCEPFVAINGPEVTDQEVKE